MTKVSLMDEPSTRGPPPFSSLSTVEIVIPVERNAALFKQK